MAKVSILMPAYNAEHYIKSAIDSVKNQIFTDWELVIVDDCSSDGTLSICEQYASNDNRIKLICQQKNLGISATKNVALSKASGEYIAFCDDDDVMDCHTLKDNIELLEKNDAQVVRWSYRTVRVNEFGDITRIIPCICQDGIYNNRNEIFENYNNVHTMLSCDWTGLYKASFLNDHFLRFNEDYKFGGEDTEFNVRTLHYLEKIVMSSKSYYDWFVRKKHSTTEKRNINFCISMIQVALMEYELIMENCVDNKELWYEYRDFYEGLIQGYAQRLTDEDKKNVNKLIKESKWYSGSD